MHSSKQELLDSMTVMGNEDLEKNAIFCQSNPKSVRGCPPYKPPVLDLLKDHGWTEVDRVGDDENYSIALKKGDEYMYIIEAPLWLGDHVVVNNGTLHFFKCYDYCTFTKKMNDITIATDIAKIRSLVNEPGINATIILDNVKKTHDSDYDMHLFSSIKANILKSGISLLQSTSSYETASLVSAFSDVVDFSMA